MGIIKTQMQLKKLEKFAEAPSYNTELLIQPPHTRSIRRQGKFEAISYQS